LRGFGSVTRHTFAGVVERGQLELGITMPLFGRPAIPLGRRRIVLGHPLAAVVRLGQTELRQRVSSLGFFQAPGVRPVLFAAARGCRRRGKNGAGAPREREARHHDRDNDGTHRRHQAVDAPTIPGERRRGEIPHRRWDLGRRLDHRAPGLRDARPITVPGA
jgi:hypothetical protein